MTTPNPFIYIPPEKIEQTLRHHYPKLSPGFVRPVKNHNPLFAPRAVGDHEHDTDDDGEAHDTEEDENDSANSGEGETGNALLFDGVPAAHHGQQPPNDVGKLWKQ